MPCIKQWITSKVIDYIDQIGIEMHPGIVSIFFDNIVKQMGNR